MSENQHVTPPPPATCVTTVGTGTQTCNGNGDGSIHLFSGSYSEYFHVFVHLANAGLIEGKYSGITGGAAGTYEHVIGTNCPKSKISNAGWAIRTLGSAGGQSGAGISNYYTADYGNEMMIGAQWASGGVPASPFLTPKEAWSIDIKMDDGRPGYGKVMMRGINVGTCSDAADQNDRDSDYVVTSNEIACALEFPHAF